jgi:hypothetical protein
MGFLSPSPAISPAFLAAYLLNNGNSVWDEMESQCDFDLHFPDG